MLVFSYLCCIIKNKYTYTMAFDIEMIKKVYSRMQESVDAAREKTGTPLTLSEKILYNTYGKEKLPNLLLVLKIM